MEIAYIPWETSPMNAVDPALLQNYWGLGRDTITDARVLDRIDSSLQELVHLREIETDHIDSRVVCSLVGANNRPDTLVFGAWYMQYGGRYYETDTALLGIIASQLPDSFALATWDHIQALQSTQDEVDVLINGPRFLNLYAIARDTIAKYARMDRGNRANDTIDVVVARSLTPRFTRSLDTSDVNEILFASDQGQRLRKALGQWQVGYSSEGGVEDVPKLARLSSTKAKTAKCFIRFGDVDTAYAPAYRIFTASVSVLDAVVYEPHASYNNWMYFFIYDKNDRCVLMNRSEDVH